MLTNDAAGDRETESSSGGTCSATHQMASAGAQCAKMGARSLRSEEALDSDSPQSNITFMALKRKKATTIALEPQMDMLLTRAARRHGVSRSEFIRRQLDLVLEQYRKHPRPSVAGIIRGLPQRGDESELFHDRA